MTRQPIVLILLSLGASLPSVPLSAQCVPADREAWQHVIAWVRHRPAAWDEEDRRKRKGLAFSTPALMGNLSREVVWSTTPDPENPWAAELDGARWQVHLNDFPDQIMYSLIIDAKEIGQVHD